MKYITSNEENLQPIIDAFNDLEKGEIIISSGWIRSDKLKEVIGPQVQKRIKEGSVSLRLLLRIGSPMDIKITDSGVFTFIKYLQSHEKSSVQWRYSPLHHAKLYATGDSWAMLGSFNLTGGGFGTEDNPGSNPEAGFVTTVRKEVSGVRARFDKMWNDSSPLNDAVIGFTANKSENGGFWMIGVKALPAGQFVQVYSDDGMKVLGKIEKSLRYHQEYHKVDEDPIADRELMYLFTNRNEDQNRLNGIAGAAGKPECQLNIAQVKLMMSVGETEKGFRFSPVNVPPAVAGAVFKADPKLLGKLFNPASSSYAVLEENKEVYVSFNDEELLTKHFAVIGSTGSGKSYFVKKYIFHRLKELVKDDLRVIIIDTHGEYGNDQLGFSPETITADEETALAAVPLRTIDDFKEYFGSHSSAEKKVIIRALEKADRTPGSRKEDTFIDVLKESVDNGEVHDIDWEAVLEDLEGSLTDEKPKDNALLKSVWNYVTEREGLDCINDDNRKKILKDRLKKRILKDIKKAFRAEESAGTYLPAVIESFENGHYRLETLNLIEKIEAPGFYRLDLTKVDEAPVRQNIAGDLMQEVFNRAKKSLKSGGSFRTLFIVDEAQNYAPEAASGKISSKKWMRTIASEGRKFGVGLIIMTQRPAYVAKDVLSQCSSQAIFRLINKGDIDQVAGTVEGIGEYDLLQLPLFTAGQALFTGVGMQMPVRVRVLE